MAGFGCSPRPDESIGASSVDVCLGNQFLVMKRQSFLALEPETDPFAERPGRYQERVVKRFGDEFVLHPRQLVIGSTFEYISLPADLMCFVVGKSTWGRMGLIIATAIKVDPGFRGCVTLEIINEGEVPLVLRTGEPIAQLVLQRTTGQDLYRGRYDCPIGPQLPRFRRATLTPRPAR